jgi:hypothetical protein
MAKFDHLGPAPYAAPQGHKWVILTGKNINATAASRTVINANIDVGDVVAVDPYRQDLESTLSSITTETVTQPQTSHIDGGIYIVVDVPSGVNDSQVGGAANERKGGYILVATAQAILANATVPDSTAVAGYLVPASGSYKLAAVGATGVASAAAIFTHKFRAEAANASGAAALRRVRFVTA